MQRTICSVFYKELTARRNYKSANEHRPGGYMTTWRLPAAEKGKYSTLVVEDMVEQFRIMSDAPPSELRVFADGAGGVAEDILNEFTGHVPGETFGAPGIFICYDNDVKDASGKVITAATEPSARELDAAIKRQTRWCTWQEMDADSKWINGRRSEIYDQHRDAATWLGHENKEWMKPPQQDDIGHCPVCGSQTINNPMVCPNCTKIIDYERFFNYERQQREFKEKYEAMERDAAEEKARLERRAKDPAPGDMKEVFALATEAFGEKKKASEFLDRPHAKLRNKTPREACLTPEGVGEVMDILAAIQGGVPA